MKVALVNPQIVTSSWSAFWKGSGYDTDIRHSLAYLSAALKAAGHTVFLLDLRLLKDWDDYEQRVKEIKPDFLGVTMHTCEWNVALKACRRAKKLDKKIITVVGGIQATMFAEEAAQNQFVDFVLKGEGEVSLPKLVENPKSFPKIFWGEPPDLDKIPFEDRELWPDYEQRIQYPTFGYWCEPPVIDMIARRGCIWQCKFCCGPGSQNVITREVNGKRVPFIRARSVEKVMEEMKILYDKYHYKGVLFHDEEFLIDPEWTKKFCQAMHDYGFVEKGIKWWAHARADSVCRYPEIIKQMKEAGLSTVAIGFESFSDRMLKWMNKGTTAQINFKAAEIAKELDINIHAHTIVGVPYEDGKWHLEDDLPTFEAIRKIKPAVWFPYYFVAHPGAPFYEWFKKNNLILDESFEALGVRFPNEGKIRGVDYKQLEKLINDCNQYLTAQSIRKNIVSIVIPIYNRGDVLLKVLEGISKQTAFDAIKEIIVVDDGSTEDIEAIISKVRDLLKGKLIFEKQANSGMASALNRGMIMAQGEIIIFLGADIIPSEDLVKEHILFHVDHDPGGNVAVIGYSVWHPSIKMTPFLYHAQERGLQSGFSNIPDPFNVSFSFACITNISYPRRFIEQSQELFDNDLQYLWADVEFAYRLQLKGLRIVYNKNALAYHLDKRSFSSFCRRMEETGYMAVMFFRKHRELRLYLYMHALEDYPWWRRLRARLLWPIADLSVRFSSKDHIRLWDEVLFYFYALGVERYYKENPKELWSQTPFLPWTKMVRQK